MPRSARHVALSWGALGTLTILFATASIACGSRSNLATSTTMRVDGATTSTAAGTGLEPVPTQALAPRTGTPPGTETTAEDLEMQASDFRNILSMTKVRGFYIDNRLGHLDEALRIASSPTGGVYPVGTIIQLIPTEIMVKRRKGFNADTRDWEFFFVGVSGAGTEIKSRGAGSVRNAFGLGCQSCHSAAEPKWDMVCEDDHGCAPLPFTDSQIESIQNSDPRPR